MRPNSVGALLEELSALLDKPSSRSITASHELEKRIKEEARRPIPGEEYVHSKTGHRYTVLAVGVYCGGNTVTVSGLSRGDHGFPEGTELVVYVGHYDNFTKKDGNRIYVRPLCEWAERVDALLSPTPGAVTVPRFCLARTS